MTWSGSGRCAYHSCAMEEPSSRVMSDRIICSNGHRAFWSADLSMLFTTHHFNCCQCNLLLNLNQMTLRKTGFASSGFI